MLLGAVPVTYFMREVMEKGVIEYHYCTFILISWEELVYSTSMNHLEIVYGEV